MEDKEKRDEILDENNKINEEHIEKEVEDEINKNINEIKSIVEKIKQDFKEKNYKKVEDNYKLIFEEKGIENIDNINKEINIIELLYNYAYTLYVQMKYESASKILFKIIVNYDNKNKDAYLLFIKILCEINEHKKAYLLLEKFNAIMNNNNMEEFNDLKEEIESKIKIKNNNIKRQYYYNAQKDIFNLEKQLHFFYWIFYSIGALMIGHYLAKIFLY